MESRRKARIAGLLVAGGHGARFGGELPKQFLELGGRALFLHAAAALDASPIIEDLVLVVPGGWEEHARELLQASTLAGKLRDVVAGGATRQDSVWRGLEKVAGCTHVLVHDAARPFLTARAIQAAVTASERYGAATVAMPVSDTLYRAEISDPGADGDAYAVTPVSRDGMWSVQTPQVFEVELLREAHRHARGRNIDATDDGRLILELGRRLELVHGAWWNIKVTRAQDLLRAEAILAMREQLLAQEDRA